MLPKISVDSGEDSDGYVYDENKFVERSTRENDAIILQAANEIVSLSSVLTKYGIKFEHQNEAWSNKISCPFSSHKAGREKTGSFNYNFKQDLFHCFGCGKSGRAVEFLAFKKGVDKYIIAQQIIKDAGGYIPKNIIIEESIDPKVDRLLYEFSEFIYSIMDNAPLEQIDKVTEWIDIYLSKYAPKRKIVVEELSVRLSKARELLIKYK